MTISAVEKDLLITHIRQILDSERKEEVQHNHRLLKSRWAFLNSEYQFNMALSQLDPPTRAVFDELEKRAKKINSLQRTLPPKGIRSIYRNSVNVGMTLSAGIQLGLSLWGLKDPILPTLLSKICFAFAVSGVGISTINFAISSRQTRAFFGAKSELRALLNEEPRILGKREALAIRACLMKKIQLKKVEEQSLRVQIKAEEVHERISLVAKMLAELSKKQVKFFMRVPVQCCGKRRLSA